MGVISDFIAHEHIAIVVELEFKAEIMNESKETSICMGYNIVMPLIENGGVLE